MPFDSSIPFWPAQLPPRDFTDPMLMNAAMQGPQPLVGAPQTVVSGAGRWSMQLSGIPIYSNQTHDRLGVWRAIFAGRLQVGLPIYLPFRDWKRGPVTRASLTAHAGVPFSDTSVFSDSTLFASGYSDCALAASAAAQATAVVVDVANVPATPAAGDFFTIGERAYLITTATADGSVANRWHWTITPGLREAAASAADVEIRNPFCRMVLNAKDRSEPMLRDLGLVGRPTLTFFEDNWT